MTRLHGLPLAALALLLGASRVGAENRWFAAAGIESPRPEPGDIGRWNRGGPSFAVGLERPMRGTTSLFGRLAAASLPPDDEAVARDRTWAAQLDVGTASLVTVAGGVRFRRQDLAFTPYFDAGGGLGFAKPNRLTRWVGSAEPIDDRDLQVGWYWTWGAGFAVRTTERLGLFLDGHWDTIPDGSPGHGMTVSLRAGIEMR